MPQLLFAYRVDALDHPEVKGRELVLSQDLPVSTQKFAAQDTGW